MVWFAIEARWRDGAALAGSSAGAMALGQWSLLRERWPNHVRRRAASALDLVPGIAAVPHRDTSGAGWRAELPAGARLLGLDERTAALWHGRAWRASGPGAVTFEGASYRDGQLIGGLPALW